MSLLKKRPLIVTAHGGDIREMPKRGPFYRFFTNLILQKSERIIAVSESLKKEIILKFDLSEGKIDVVNMGVPEKFFKGISQRKRKAPILLFVGRMEKVKGPDIAIRAMEYLFPVFQLIMVGDEKVEEYQEIIKGKKWEGKVNFIGGVKQDQLPSFYTKAFLTLIPSREEGFGLVGLESMACGTPVLAHETGGLKEYIQDGVNGFLIKTLKPKEWAEKILKLWELANTSLWKRIILEGYKTALKHHALLKAKEVKKIYNKALKKGG